MLKTVALSIKNAFSAYAGVSTSLPTSAETKVGFNTEEFDTNSNFSSSRFTPTVAGYYQINAAVRIENLLSNNTAYVILYKNGAAHKIGQLIANSVAGSPILNVSSVVYMNGTTDYLEIFAFQNSGLTLTTQAGSSVTWFNGCLL